MIQNITKMFLNYISVVISFFIPRSAKWVVCGGWFGQRFADNSKSMYLYLFHNKERLGLHKVVFATRNKSIYHELKNNGFDVCLVGTLYSGIVHLRSLFHIIDAGGVDLSRIWSVSAIRINLWHGFPLKKIGFLIQDSVLDEYCKFKQEVHLGNWDSFYNLALSEKHSVLQQQAFNLSKEQMILGMYPRIVYMKGNIERFHFETEKQAIQVIKSQIDKGKRIVCYFPTFRDDEQINNICMQTTTELIDFLKEMNICLVTKMHFASGKNIENTNSNILINLPRESDVNNFLDLCSVLITDYSSVYFDYLLLNRPVVFYAFDLNYYTNKDRGFVFEYNSFTPGAKAYNINELKKILLLAIDNPNAYLSKYKKTREEVLKVVYSNMDMSITAMDELWDTIVSKKHC